jgi:hypothetical protein
VRSRFISQPPVSSRQARPQYIFEFAVTKNAEQGLGLHLIMLAKATSKAAGQVE